MARPATGHEFIEAAKEQIAAAKTADALRAAQALPLPLEFGLSLEQQTATAIGLSKSWAGKLRRRFQRAETSVEQVKTKKELRNHARMTLDEEEKFLAPFIDQAQNAGIIIVPPLKVELERHLGRSMTLSTVYRLLHRHGWRTRSRQAAPTIRPSGSAGVGENSPKKSKRRNPVSNT
ncbi:winged helix-turn-helix domain-containing protein [Sulfurirhabdus autotrophica]|uniref:Winged helix-turn-helix protein n=1 Tax=Sulfurirhabdus autotrophica TaxID=1706046 RepID=A0A4R3XY38_9PROT|nr:winged helix-turn-helix domain-containing protein [Sulfurirhabdus autotrophica]TCV82704.1 winged helix-turn-helix protein [Sulfurirhabdus autotrophica]